MGRLLGEMDERMWRDCDGGERRWLKECCGMNKLGDLG